MREKDNDFRFLVARSLEQKDWHKLSEVQKEIVKKLEESGHLSKVEPPSGFTGFANKNKD